MTTVSYIISLKVTELTGKSTGFNSCSCKYSQEAVSNIVDNYIAHLFTVLDLDKSSTNETQWPLTD